MPEPEAAIRKGSVKSGLRCNRRLQPEGAFLELLQIIVSLNWEDFLKDHLTEIASISGEAANIPAENQFNFEEKKKGEDTERNRPTLYYFCLQPILVAIDKEQEGNDLWQDGQLLLAVNPYRTEQGGDIPAQAKEIACTVKVSEKTLLARSCKLPISKLSIKK